MKALTNAELYQKHREKKLAAAKRGDMRRIQRYNEYIAGRGGKCEICKGEFDPCVFDLHHPDPAGKTRTITAKAFTNGSRGDEARKEADACVLLCSNCHRLEHQAWRHGGTLL